MKLDALEHPKTLDLASRLDTSLPATIGHLELLWAFTGKYAPAGDIGRHSDGAIARACHWAGRPELFTQALREAGFIEANSTYRLTIHDWHDHAPRWVKSKLKSMSQTFITGIAPKDTSEDTGDEASEDSKGSEEKRSEEKTGALALAVPGLDLEAWGKWVAYRKSIGKPLKPASMAEAAKAMAAHGSNQAACVAHSMANSYQGLYAPKDSKKSTPAADVRSLAIERIKQHASNIQCPLVPRETEPAETYETRVKQWERENVRPAPGVPKFTKVVTQ